MRASSAGFLAALCVVALGLPGCTAAPENGILRAERQRREDALRIEREALDRERRLLELAVQEDREAMLPLRTAAADAAQRRREAARSVQHEEAQLSAQQQVLDERRAKVAALQQELDALRAAVAEVETKELRLAALRERSTQLDTELQAAQRDVDAKTAEVAPRVEALRAKLGALAALAAQIDAVFPPPAAPAAPAANPADQPK